MMIMKNSIDKSQGYVLFWRSLKDTVIFRNAKLWQAYSWCLFRANYKPTEELPGLEKVYLRAGQFITSTRHAAEALHISVATLYGYFSLLESEHLIERKGTTKYTVITIQSWDELQNPERKSEHKLEHKLDTDNTFNTKAAAAVVEILSLKGRRASLNEDTLFVNGKKVNNPIAYLEAIKNSQHSLPPQQPLKPAKEMTDTEILEHLHGKVPGRDEGINEDILYEAIERRIYKT